MGCSDVGMERAAAQPVLASFLQGNSGGLDQALDRYFILYPLGHRFDAADARRQALHRAQRRRARLSAAKKKTKPPRKAGSVGASRLLWTDSVSAAVQGSALLSRDVWLFFVLADLLFLVPAAAAIEARINRKIVVC